MRDDLSREEVTAAIDAVVEGLLRQAKIQGPPVDALTLAQRHLGLEVSLGRKPRPRGREREHQRPEPTEEQRQWAAAQAVAAHSLGEILRRLGADGEGGRPRGAGSLANLFAPRLLLPACWFAADAAGADFDVADLQARYRTAGHEAVALRLLDLAEPCIITVVDNGHIHRRRSNAWPVRRQLAPAEQECQRYVNYYSRPRLVSRGGWTVRGWPVHRADWKREILRSVVEEGAEGEAPAEVEGADGW